MFFLFLPWLPYVKVLTWDSFYVGPDSTLSWVIDQPGPTIPPLHYAKSGSGEINHKENGAVLKSGHLIGHWHMWHLLIIDHPTKFSSLIGHFGAQPHFFPGPFHNLWSKWALRNNKACLKEVCWKQETVPCLSFHLGTNQPNYCHNIKDSLNCENKNIMYCWKWIKDKCPDFPNFKCVRKSVCSFQDHMAEHQLSWSLCFWSPWLCLGKSD